MKIGWRSKLGVFDFSDFSFKKRASGKTTSLITPTEEERKESLKKTLRLEAKFGLRLFSQGAKWGFKNWDNNKKLGGILGGHTIVMLPALLKMTNENGHHLSDPIIVHEATSVDF